MVVERFARTAALLPILMARFPYWGTIFSSLLAYTMKADGSREGVGNEAGIWREAENVIKGSEGIRDGRMCAIRKHARSMWQAGGEGTLKSGILVFFPQLSVVFPSFDSAFHSNFIALDRPAYGSSLKILDCADLRYLLDNSDCHRMDRLFLARHSSLIYATARTVSQNQFPL